MKKMLYFCIMFLKQMLLWLAFFCVFNGDAQEELSLWLRTDSTGAGNMLFAGEKIGIGQEGNVQLKTTFILGSSVWGRAYFPKQYREYGVKKKDRFRLDLFIDGQIRQTVYQEHPEPHWSQMQIWLYGTGNDYFDRFEELLKDAGQGEHIVDVVLMVELARPVAGKDNVNISKGSFNLIVP